MKLSLDEMRPIEVFNEDLFLGFVIEKSPINSVWVIDSGYFNSEEESFLKQLANVHKIKKNSEYEITLTPTNKTQLLTKLSELTFPIHHSIYTRDEVFMVSYDSFSACWISMSIPLYELDALTDAKTIQLIHGEPEL